MIEQKQIILKRIDELLKYTNEIYSKDFDDGRDENCYFKAIYGTISILKTAYGENSDQEKTLISLKDGFLGNLAFRNTYIHDSRMNLTAILETLKSEINYGLLSSLENMAAGEIYGDMLTLAKRLFDEGEKESSAILSCGALEDSMKKYAAQKGLEVYDADLSQVVNALKSGGYLKGTQAGVIQSYVQLRNKAFHAQFTKIEMPEIISLISFVQQFILENFK